MQGPQDCTMAQIQNILISNNKFAHNLQYWYRANLLSDLFLRYNLLLKDKTQIDNLISRIMLQCLMQCF